MTAYWNRQRGLYAPLRCDDELADTEAANTTPLVGDPWSDAERDDLADWPTTRRFSRSEHGPDAAFPADPKYGQAIEPPPAAAAWRIVDVLHALALVALAIVIAILIVERH